MKSDYVEVAVVLDQPRRALWRLICAPELYSRFFRGVATVTQIPVPGRDQPPEYWVRASSGDGHMIACRMRTVTNRPAEKLVFSGEPDIDSWISINLVDTETGGTEIFLRISKPANLRARGSALGSSEIVSWVREGVQRISDFLSGAPNSVESNRGEHGPMKLSVAKTVIAAGVVGTSRPDRGIRQLNSVARWGFTLPGGYGAAAALGPKDIALADNRTAHTYKQVDQRTTSLAAGLKAKGVGETSKVAVLARNSAAMVECMVACAKLGADLVLLNTGFAKPQVEEIVRQHGVEVLCVDDEFAGLTRDLPPDLLQISTNSRSEHAGSPTVDELIVGAPWANVSPPKDPARLIVLTSGTTGTPKGARRPTPKGFGAIAAMLSRMPLQVGERMLIAAPLFHSWGLAALQLSMPLRAKVVLTRRFDAEDCLRKVSLHRCTSLIVVPIMLQRIVNLPEQVRAKYDTSSLRVVASSGAPLDGALVTEFMNSFGDVLYNFYGSTEVSWATVADPFDLRAVPTTAGRPPLGTRLGILGEDGVPVPRGAMGRIFVGNEMLFDGYTNGTTLEMEDKLMDTGDLGYLDADGRLFVSGRADEMIISGGENVFPRPVEEALSGMPQINEAAVVGVSDDEFGQRLAAFIVLQPGAQVRADEVRDYLHQRLPRASMPRDINFMSGLPRNSTGKVVKRLLAEPG